MGLDDVLERLRAEIALEGGVRLWAAAHQISVGYVYDVLAAKRPPSERLLDALGLERTYQEREKDR